ncbi:MAG: thioredoxin domain-containing protein [Rhodanobacter sp.]|nr:MAG: thioredoxin domain-containing protein [Rhodanobacter sp.]TAM13498.1 MAG: thioredoxin domain-containing protein [Rhodanobacter sp.]TAM35749.1 MAG: thioredoxin domain-containing protein [Rhodanobacter sp.]
MSDFHRNMLADAASPYLRQHAGNPVHWQTWNAATLAHARETDTPILLSAGYSACHWCHVMAHESFENPAIARVMNAHFVCIKLDREERPDIDRVYQLAHQALHGRGGGWPLTAFIDPQDLVPFFTGTYFPPAPRHGLPAFGDLLVHVRDYFDAHRDALREQATALREWLAQVESNPAPASALPDVATTQALALEQFTANFDPQHGGSAGAPKFPRAAELEWLLGLPDAGTRNMAHLTLRQMAQRGLQDHLGGGFFRYCVDADWTIPHFEKMLYDNAQLLPAYARAAADAALDAGTRTLAHRAASGIVDWIEREMTLADGTFASSLDADSEHEEGKFYLWTRGAMAGALDAPHAALALAAYGLDRAPNFEARAWHLVRDESLDTLATSTRRSPEDTARALEEARQSLLAVRMRRTPPNRDDKTLTAWNALAITGLARSALMLDDARRAALAQRALEGLRHDAWLDGTLYANIAPPAARIPGFLDDHAFLLDALLETLQWRFDPQHLAWATALADALLERFVDPASGAFWFAAAEHATPLARGRQYTDDALPNGNAVAIRALLRLGHLIGETRYLDAAERALQAGAAALTQLPAACPTLLRAQAEAAHPRRQLVVRCAPEQAAAWRATVRTALAENNLSPATDAIDVFVIDAPAGALPGVLGARAVASASGSAQLCTGLTCQLSVTDPAKLSDALRA